MTNSVPASSILRHKAAIRRSELSLAFKCLQRDQLLSPAGTVFDDRRRSAAPRRRISEVRFDTHREILEPLIDWIGQQGRLPEPDEFTGAEPVIAEFGSLKRAFALIGRVSSSEEWEQIRKRRTEDLLVALALGKFRRRPFGSVDRRTCRENAGFPGLVAQMVATDTPENGCERLLSVAETDPELARLVSAWPTLSAVVKRMILAALESLDG